MRRIGDKVHRLAPRLVLCTFSAFAVISLWVVAINQIWTEEKEAVAGATKDVTNIARTLEEHTVRTIQSADQAVLFLKYEYEQQGSRFDLARYVDTGITTGNIFNLYSIANERGDLIASNKPFTPINLSDRQHFTVHRDSVTDRLFVSKPVLGRLSGKWSIQMTRRLEHADGAFAGIVVVSLDPFYFSRLYGDVDLGSEGAVTLVGRDGIVRARQSLDDKAIGKDISNQAIFRTLLSQHQGTTRGISSLDGIERLYAFRELADYPFYVVVGVSMDTVLAPYREVRRQVLLLAGLSSIAVIGATILLLVLIARLERSRARAVEMNRSKSEFLANMSHELRTPLNGILGYAELLQEDLAGTPQQQFADAVRTSGSHLLAIVNDILDIGKIEAGYASLVLTEESPATLAAEAIEGHLAAAQRKRLQLTLYVGPDVPLALRADRTKIIRVLNNLLHNAIKFTDDGGVRLTVERRRGEVIFTVSDTGPGIPSELHEAVFDKFVQADSSIAKSHEGTGLGLALCRELCMLMKGRIWVKSAQGAGASFAFALPLEPRLIPVIERA